MTDWLTNLAESNSSELTPLQREAIAEAVIGNVSAEPSLQNFQMFRTQFQSTDDDSDLYTRFGRWCENGEFGWLFSGEDEDNLTIQNQVCGFNLTEVFDNAVIRTTWLSYIFRRIERMVEDLSLIHI